jgi:hypothetical protein
LAVHHRNVLRTHSSLSAAKKRATIVLEALQKRLTAVLQNLAGCVNHLGDLAAGRFFTARGIAARDPNSYFCVVGEKASEATHLSEDQYYLWANALHSE